MAHKIKARHFVVTSAFDFFKFCREYYQTPVVKGTCQHYRVEFEFIRPSDIRRHQDSDLDQPVPQTHKIYSVQNTPETLTLKVCDTPCLCPPCITESGECLNASHADPLRLVKLVPERGANLRKYQKRKRPDAQKQNSHPDEVVQHSSNDDGVRISYKTCDQDDDANDDELQSIIFEDVQEGISNLNSKDNNNGKQKSSKETNGKNTERIVTDTPVTDTPVTDTTGPNELACSWLNHDEYVNTDYVTVSPEHDNEITDDIEVIDISSHVSKEHELAATNSCGN